MLHSLLGASPNESRAGQQKKGSEDIIMSYGLWQMFPPNYIPQSTIFCPDCTCSCLQRAITFFVRWNRVMRCVLKSCRHGTMLIVEGVLLFLSALDNPHSL